MRRLPIGLLCSAAVHAALLLGVLAAIEIRIPPVLFVDLVHEVRQGLGLGVAEAPPPSLAAAGGEPRPVPREPAAARVTPPRRPAPASRPVAPAPPAAPPAPVPSERPPVPEPVQATTELPPLAPSANASEAAPSAPVPAPAVIASATSTGGGDGALAVGGSASEGGAAARDVGSGAAGSGRATGEGGGALALAVPGSGGDGAEYAGYLAQVRRRIQESLAYPTAARRRGLTGTVQIELAIEATGAISEVLLAASSSHRLLDEAALEAVRGLERVPFPSGLRPRRLRVRLPVVFDLR